MTKHFVTWSNANSILRCAGQKSSLLGWLLCSCGTDQNHGFSIAVPLRRPQGIICSCAHSRWWQHWTMQLSPRFFAGCHLSPGSPRPLSGYLHVGPLHLRTSCSRWHPSPNSVSSAYSPAAVHMPLSNTSRKGTSRWWKLLLWWDSGHQITDIINPPQIPSP